MRACLIFALISAQTFLALGADASFGAKPDPFKAFGIELDIENRQVRVDGTICCTHGVLEYVGCLPDTFEHESIFSIRCKPSVLHMCLLAIGLESRALNGIDELRKEDQNQKISSVNIEVEYEKNGNKTRHPISDFIAYRNGTKKDLPNTWVFTGSFFGHQKGKPVYAADINGGVIGLGQDISSVLQFSEEVGNPYNDDEQGLEINSDAVPEKGTKVQLIFMAHRPKPAKTKDPVTLPE